MKPTLYLSNWSSHRTPGMHGPRMRWTIMARPRHFERGDGTVLDLTPTAHNLPLMLAALADRTDAAAMTAYRESMERGWEAAALSPGPALGWDPAVHLFAVGPDGRGVVVADGDTLCCACSRDEAAAGRCHRAWAAPFLRRAGWRVVLDGVET